MSGAQALGAIRDRLEHALGAGRLPDTAARRGAQLLARLKSPVSVVVIGRPGAGKSSLINMLLGTNAIPETRDLPVLEIAAGAMTRTLCTLGDGSQVAAEGVVLDAGVPEDAALVRIELAVPVLERMTLTEIRLAGSLDACRAAVDLAVERADMVLWCSQDFDDGERALWAGVPDDLKDHSFLVLTKADRLLMQGTLNDRLAGLEPVVAEEFYSLYPVATLQAIAARIGAPGENPALWKASGGRALALAVAKEVETGRSADADSALLFLTRFGARDGALETASPAAASAGAPDRPAREAVAPPPGAGADTPPAPAAPATGGDHGLGPALSFLASRTGAMARDLPDDADGLQQFVLDHCLETATGLSDMLASVTAHDPVAADLQADAAEGMDMMLLLQLEQSSDAAEDAVTLLLQMKKELAECAAAARR